MKRVCSSKLVTVMVAIVVLIFVAFEINERPMSYSAFMKHDQKYYAEVAAACDAFLAGYPGSATTNIFIPDDNPGNDFMPPILRDLNSGRIETAADFLKGTNTISRMLIMVGVKKGKLNRGGFEIIWENDHEDPSLWNLSTHTEGLPDEVVFSLRKTTGLGVKTTR